MSELVPAGKLAPLAIKDPRAVELAFTPRPPVLNALESLALIGIGGSILFSLVPITMEVLEQSLRFSASDLVGFLFTYGGFFLFTGLSGVSILSVGFHSLSVRVSGRGPEDPLAPLPWMTRLAGVGYMVSLLHLTMVLAMVCFAPLLAAPGLSVSPPGLVTIILLAHGSVFFRCTAAGSRAAAHLHALGAPRNAVPLLLGLPGVIFAGLMLRMASFVSFSFADLSTAALVFLPLYAFGMLSLSVFLLAATRPGTVTHEQLVSVVRKSRPGLVESLTASAWRGMLAVVLVLSAHLLSFPLRTALRSADYGTLSIFGVISLVWVGWIGRLLWDLRPIGLLGKRFTASSLEELRRPLLTGSVVCRYCGAPVLPEEAVVCRDCETHHHGECWEEFGGCTVYGCGSTSFRRID